MAKSGPRKTNDITIPPLIRHINHHNNAIGWALFVPAMEGHELGLIVKMVDMDILTAQPPAHTRPMAGVNKFAILLRTEAWAAHTRKVTPFALGMAPMPLFVVTMSAISDIFSSQF